MKVIDGKDAVLGRLSSFVSKELLKGEEISIVNCDDIIITGNKKNIESEFKEKRSKYGSSQKGPIHSREIQKIVKRAIRGMLPNFRKGRGREAFKKIRCYSKVPKQFEETKKISFAKDKKSKFVRVSHLSKK